MLWALFLFVALMVGTPGPANMVLMSAGARYGLRASLRFIFGVTAGKFLLNGVIALGLYDLLRAMPMLFEMLTYISALFMIWLSFSMIHGSKDAAAFSEPPGFSKGLMVHPLNPKAWAMLTIAWSSYGSIFDDPWLRFAFIAGIFLGVQLVFHSLWCYAGARLIKMLPSERSRYLVEVMLALMTVALVLLIVFF